MEAKDIKLKATEAKATFSVESDICLTDVSKALKLPGFQAPDDDDLTWIIEIKQVESPTWTPDVGIASKLRLSIRFESRSNKKSVYAIIKVNIRQRVGPEDLEYIINEVSESNLEKVTQDDFSLTYDACLTEYSNGSSYSLGHIYFANRLYNSLTIKATVNVTDLTLEAHKKKWTSIPIAWISKSLGYCLQILLESGMFSDVTLKAGGQEVLVHRNILAVRSDVFKDMLHLHEDGPNKTSPRVIHIKDISFPVLMGIIR